jgi:hypothetical protein
MDNLGANLGANLRANLGANLRDNLWDNLGANLRTNLGANLGDKINHTETSYYGNLSDYGWTCFYDFINNELIHDYKLELWNKWKLLINSNIYDMIQLNGLCIAIAMPCTVNINERKRLHSENSPAVEWKDGYKVYSWNGMIVPEKWIMDKKSITKNDIISETNAEKRRCLQEILGKRFAELLGIEIIDSDIDGQGFPMNLYKTIEIDSVANKYIYYLQVICPSTKREYFLCVPDSKNVWEAKAWTFKNNKIQFRHGDIGLLNIKKEFDRPVCES